MAVQRQSHVPDHAVRPAVSHQVHGLAHIDQPGNRPVRYPVVHGHDDGFFRITVHDSFKTDFLSSHGNNNSSPCIPAVYFSCKPEGLPVPEIIPEIIAEIKAKVAIRGRTCVHDFRNGCFDAAGG